VAETPKTFPCPHCGGQLAWNPAVQEMACSYCGATVPVPKEGPFEAEEHDLLSFLEEHPKAKGYGVELKTLSCKQCGAVVQLPPSGRRDLSCPFCDTPYVAEETGSQAAAGVILPESLIPFKVALAECQEKFRDWIGSGWFRPNDLKAMASLGKITGLYLPFFTFDALARSAWRAMAGFYYYVTEKVSVVENGKNVWREQRVQKVRWEPASGTRSDFYDDVLVPAVKEERINLILKVYPYDTKNGLVAYDTRYLAGFGILNPDMELKFIWQIAKSNIEADQISKCSRDVPGDTQRDLVVKTTLSGQTFKHLLCPLWAGSFRYKGKVYNFVVNGETGALYGEKPWSWVKITLAAIIAAAIAVAAYYFFGRQ
jgi:hypothetical protein